ncbi:hypothetical protein Tco_1536377 [Tanacetum coccineum]
MKMEHAKKQQKSQYTISSDKTTLVEFVQKQALFDSMHESKSFNKHPANKTLYHTLMESLIADENTMDQGVADLLKHKKRSHDDDDRDQDPPVGPDKRVEEKEDNQGCRTAQKAKVNWFF